MKMNGTDEAPTTAPISANNVPKPEDDGVDNVRPSLKHSSDNASQPGISLMAYEIRPDGPLEECEVQYAVEQARQKLKTMHSSVQSISDEESASAPQSSFWIDIQIPTPNDLSLLARHESQVLDTLPPFLKRHLLQPSQLQIAQTLILPQSALIVLRILPNENSSSKVMRHAAAICLKGLLITITTAKNDQQQPPPKLKPSARKHIFDDSSTRHLLDQELLEASTAGALSAWLYLHTTRVCTATHRLRISILDLCERMEESPDSVDLSEILSLRDSLLRLGAVTEEQEEVVQALHKGHEVTQSLNFGGPLKAYLKATKATCGAAERTVSRLDARLTYVRTMYDALQQDRINRRLAVLTIVSAIFLPLSLMAGIWGMNFVEIPLIEQEYGFYYALVSMLGVALILILVFWRLGWFA